MADTEYPMFYIAIVTDSQAEGERFIQIEAKRRWNVSTLLKELQSSKNEPSALLKAVSKKSAFYMINEPFEYNNQNPPDVLRASLQDTAKYTKIKKDTSVKNLSRTFIEDHLYLVIEDASDGTQLAVEKLKQNNLKFFQCLTIKVKRANHWTKDDVRLNNAVFLEHGEEPREIQDLQSKLLEKRVFDPSLTTENLTIAMTCTEFGLSYVPNDTPTSQSNDPATVENPLEFLAFYNLLSCYIPDADRYKTPKSTSIKSTALKSNFILPAYFWGKETALRYTEELAWSFPAFIQCDAMSDLPRKYAPRNDFAVWFGKPEFPLITGEVVSHEDERDRFRMLLQAIALARVIFALRGSGSIEHPFIVAVYLTKELKAERYIVMKNPNSESDEVLISPTEYDLTDKDGAITFQREMYNLASILRPILGKLLDPKRLRKLEAVKKDASKMKSLHTGGAWNKGDQSESQGGQMRSIPEEGQGSGPVDEDDLGVFGDDDLRDALAQMNYQVAYVAYGFSHLAPIMDRTSRDLVGCLKFVKDGKEKEIEILRYLSSLASDLNHTVRPFGFWSVTGGSIIGMPAAGNRLTFLTDPDAHLWSVTTQLFEAVKFMHDHNVAHMDLKPGNILIPSAYGRLTIVDFGLSVQVKNKTSLLEGRAGTEGYIAPEVGKTKFSPIRADLWSVGKVVKELCMLCRPSTPRDRLFVLCEQLLKEDPSKRPMMSEALEWMSNLDAFDTRPGDQPSSFTPILPSRLAAVNA